MSSIDDQLIADFSPYTDRYGLITPDRNGSSGNGLLYTAHFLIACSQHGLLPLERRSYFHAVYDQCQVELGLMKRHPDHPGQDSIDDYIGCGTASYLMGNDLAENIIRYGKKRFPWYNYNNVEPGKFTLASWLGRFPALICHLHLAAGHRPSIFSRIVWIISVLYSLTRPRKEQDSFTLSWHMVFVAKRRGGPILRWVAKFWEDYNAKRGWTISQILSEYFIDKEHPLIKWLA